MRLLLWTWLTRRTGRVVLALLPRLARRLFAWPRLFGGLTGLARSQRFGQRTGLAWGLLAWGVGFRAFTRHLRLGWIARRPRRAGLGLRAFARCAGMRGRGAAGLGGNVGLGRTRFAHALLGDVAGFGGGVGQAGFPR